MHPFDIFDHIVYVLVAGLDPELFVDDRVHLRDGETALEEQFDLLLDLLVRDDVPVFDLYRVVVVHTHGAGPQVAHAVLAPFELAMDWAVGEQGLFQLDALVQLFVTAGSSVATEEKVCNKTLRITF